MQARRLKPTETLQEYFLTMRDLAHKGAVDDSSLIDYIIDGIPDSSNNKIILYGSKTLSEFKDKLKIYETLLNSKHSKQFPDKRFRDYENSTSNHKRRILSLAHRIFDPIGFTCPITLIPKLLIQECWKIEASLDSKLPIDIERKFET
ncbi:retrovirus-related Pol polyprotein from transposon 17.6 [Trichonephila clavipes]|nr:retrovirus-related Pol polyprotein from transposon 17.6 [Trichonephila clavipes]